MCIVADAASGAAEQAQNWRLVVGLERLGQEVEVALNEPGNGRAPGGCIALGASNHLFIHAERQLRHIRMITLSSYVSPS